MIDVVCDTLVNLASSPATRHAFLSSSHGSDALRVLVCLLPQLAVAGGGGGGEGGVLKERRRKSLEQAVRVTFMFSEVQPARVVEAGGMPTMLFLVRAQVCHES